MICPWKESVAGKKAIQGLDRITDMFYLSETFPLVNFGLKPHPISYPLSLPPPPPPPVSQVAVCRRTLLAGNSASVSLAVGGKEPIHFPCKLPKCLKWLQKALFTHCCCL